MVGRVTPERYQKIRRTLEKRQPDLTVLLENVHKPHNFSAILRTCDAVGVFEAHAITPEGGLRPSGGIASGSHRWVRVNRWSTLDSALAPLRDRGVQLLAAHPAPEAIDFRDVDYTKPTAVLLGQELDGLTEEALGAADRLVIIPMHGFVESLNVSVATALILFEAQRQRFDAGMYESCRLDDETFQKTLFEWTQPEIAELCRRRSLDYPDLDEEGEPVGWVER